MALPALALIIALTGGCSTLVDLAAEPQRFTFELRQEPLRAAACLAGNVDRYRSPYSARIAPGEASAIARVTVTGTELMLVTELYARGDASTAIVTTVRPFYDRDAFIAAMVEEC